MKVEECDLINLNDTEGKTKKETENFEVKKVSLSQLSNAEKEILILGYQKDVCRYLSVFGICSQQLEDAVQDTFAEAWTHIGDVKDLRCFKAWIIAIARNQGIKYLKKTQLEKQRLCSLDSENGKVEFAASETDNVSAQCINRMDYQFLTRLIEGLSSKEATVIKLYYIEGQSLKEISSIIGEGYSNTRTIISRARHKLRKKIQEKTP